MQPEDMVVLAHDERTDPTPANEAMVDARASFDKECVRWLTLYEDKLGKEHFLRGGPERIRMDGAVVEYARDADLVLSAKAAQGVDKVLVQCAIKYTMTWPRG